MNLGAILHLNGKLQEAEANYLRALQLKPDDTITQSNLRKLWNIMEKQGLRTMSPWTDPARLPAICTPDLGERVAYTLLIRSSHPVEMEETQGGCLLREAVTVPHSPPNDAWALHTPQGSSFPQKHCSQFGRRYMVFGPFRTFFKISSLTGTMFLFLFLSLKLEHLNLKWDHSYILQHLQWIRVF